MKDLSSNRETYLNFQSWHEIGYKSLQKGCLEEFLRTGESWRWLGDPRSKNVRRTVFFRRSPSSFFLGFNRFWSFVLPFTYDPPVSKDLPRCVKITRMREKFPADRCFRSGK
jgi:hypothetical protein